MTRSTRSRAVFRAGHQLAGVALLALVAGATSVQAAGTDAGLGGADARGASPGGSRWEFAARSPQGYDVYYDAGRLVRTGTQAQVWILHNFEPPAGRRGVDTVLSRVLLAEFDCAGGRWTLRHAATYTEHFAGGRRLSADDLHPTEADYRRTAPGSVMDFVRLAACR